MNYLAARVYPQFFRFLIAGGIAAGANYGSRFIYSNFLSYETAITCAYLTGMLVAFLLMRGHVFNACHGAILPQIIKFTAINALALAQTLIISVFLARWVLPAVGVHEHAEALGHLVGVIFPAITSYFGHKLLTFR